jgi:hypothetical protein
LVINVMFTPGAAPVITAISPATLTASSTAQLLTFTGTGFQAGMNVALTAVGGGINQLSGGLISVSSSTSFQIDVALPNAGTYQIVVTNPNGAISNTYSFQVSGALIQTISHIADGGGWSTFIILVNTDTVTASYAVDFWEDTGGYGSGTGSVPYSPPLATGAATGTIPVGGSVILHTADASPNLNEGWAQVISSQKIGGTAIFRLDTAGQEAAVPLLTSGGLTLEVPYEVGNGLALGVAIANPSTTQTANITEAIRDQNGNQLSSRNITIAPLSHFATNPPALNSLTGNGVVVYQSNVDVYGLGIRALSPAFTSIDAVLPQAPSTKTISHIADGGGWSTIIVLVNTDTVPASYTVNFWEDTGGYGSGTGSVPYTPPLATGSASGIIPVGGMVILQTAGADPNLNEGWAQVVSNQSVGGTAIFRLDTAGQEAAVPLLTTGGLSLEIPYEVGNGLALGVAIANPSATQTAIVTEIIRDQNGNPLSSRNITIAPLSHFATNPPALNSLTGNGVVEYDSNVNIYALGIRADVPAFTSVRAVYK